MNIAYIVPSLAQAGNVCVVKDLATIMCKNGHKCVVYYFDDTEKGYEFPCETIRICMKEVIPFEKYDIVHTHALRPDIYAFFHFPCKTKAHLVCTIHNHVFKDLIDEWGKLLGTLIAILWQMLRIRNERLLVLSQTHYNYYIKWFGRKKTRIAYNTRVLDINTTIPQDDIEFFKNIRKRFDIICSSICRITEIKGLDQIINALPFVDNNICYVIIGDGPKCQNLKELSTSLGLTDRVFFLGNRSDGHRYFRYIDIFCIPSHSEGFPLAMLEAACYGKTIVSSNLPVFKEIFGSEECVICKENDIQSYANGIKYAVENIESIGHNAHNRFKSSYSPNIFYETHYKIYKELIEK